MSIRAPLSPIAAAAEKGQLEALRLDLSLRDAERSHRDTALASPRSQGLRGREEGLTSATSLPPDLARLKREHAQLAAFHAAVMRSLGWRALQALRRLVGRAW